MSHRRCALCRRISANEVIMSSTIYYKGTLKDSSSAEELYNAVLSRSSAMNCRIVRESDSFYIEFTEGSSEPLLFQLKDRKINWFCKWNNPGNPDEYYRIFDLFLAIKPFFKSLRIDDDEGAWQEYLLKSKPCKIHLRRLSTPAELSLLARELHSAHDDFSGFLKSGMRFIPYSNAVYALIAQDFLRIFKAGTVNDLDKHRILKLANRLRAAEDEPFTRDNFAFMFPYMLLQIWIACCLTYKNEGRVYRLSDELRGLRTNKLAAEFGILSVFLNIHSGTVNYKHAEMTRFAREYIYTGPKSGERSIQAKAALTRLIKEYIAGNNIDTTSKELFFIPMTDTFKDACETIFAGGDNSAPDLHQEDIVQSLEVLVSILDYLGFRYVGPEEPGNRK